MSHRVYVMLSDELAGTTLVDLDGAAVYCHPIVGDRDTIYSASAAACPDGRDAEEVLRLAGPVESYPEVICPCVYPVAMHWPGAPWPQCPLHGPEAGVERHDRAVTV